MSDLSTLGLLSVEGIDAKKLLQGQLTCNLDDLPSQKILLGAHCNPQGRVISLFRLFLYEEKYFLLMPRESIPVAQKALQKYAVFFKVKLSDASDQIQAFSVVYPNFIHPDWKVRDIQSGIPAIYPETSEKFLPHELNLPAKNAVSFNKGCYTGQEVIARMQYLGKLKTHLYQGTVSAPPHRNNALYTREGKSGEIVDFVEISYNVFALLFIAKESDISSSTFFLDAENKIKLELKNG